MLPKLAVSYGQLIKEGFSERKIKAMSATLKLFPTPFKGIYYAPAEAERKGGLIETPLKALSMALVIYLGTNDFYYGCATAEEFFGLRWNPSGEVHVVNTVRSGRIDLEKRIERNKKKGTYRAKKIAHILSFYGREIVFHKVRELKSAKVKETPYGRFATKAQIKKDQKRFREVSRKKV